MSMFSKTLAKVLAAAVLVMNTPAFANQADKVACNALAEGDACKDGDGRAGYCVPDASDPSVLTCEDLNSGGNGSGGNSSSGGSGGDDSSRVQPIIACSAVPGHVAPLPLSLLAMAAIAWGRRRSRSR